MSERDRRPELPVGTMAPVAGKPEAPAAEEGDDHTAREEPEATGQGESDGFDDEDGVGDEGSIPGIDDLFGGAGRNGRGPFIYAPNGNINTGSVHGGQRVSSHSHTTGAGTHRVEAREGPISEDEIEDAAFGFAEPEWFPEGLRKLDSGVLFLTGAPGSGRRTTALNLLHRHSGSMALRAVDSDMDLATWRPTHADARGYLVDGLVPKYPLRPGMVGNLRSLLHQANARMVIVLPEDPELVRRLERDLHVTPQVCRPAPPRAVFDARLRAAVPDPVHRNLLLAGLEPGLLDDLLVPELVPAEVAELVAAVVDSGEDGTDATGLRNRLSFLAEGEVPDLIKDLRDDSDGLAFLLATCVFEGLDHRIIREESERLLEVAEGRLDSVLPPSEEGTGDQGKREQPRPNPHFVFRRSLEDLLRSVRAQCAPKEIRATSQYTFAVEPVRFTRQRQAETVLRYVWREYGRLSQVLTSWMDSVRNETELTQPVGRVMGMAAGWGGGRRALRHIGALAGSERRSSRIIAAHAMGVAAKDPVLATEVKHRLREWSWARSQQLRSTVAYTCGTDFGLSRPDLAMRLLGGLHHGLDDEGESAVRRAVDSALVGLFNSGSQTLVFRHLAEWAGQEGTDAELALRNFPRLLADPSWFQQQLLGAGECAWQIVDLVHRTLDDDDTFDTTARHLIGWCRMAAWSEQQKEAVETLLTALAQDMRHGVFRLFVVIDRHEDTDLVGRDIARRALNVWREGEPAPRPPYSDPHSSGRTS
ncbi:hypothetical protein [Streptomyces malaysiensis]|uniref:LigA protein n=1 Tax=Streptomyces malaysiensis subsp. samsunensis TaxID=459658 RepID=A0A9X2LSJ6_STRMQ|nr:hypothetical protein [Streptomyces samsunensis]MCQ8828832.1 hypothetical protein [Streptomyces samsunensis]